VAWDIFEAILRAKGWNVRPYAGADEFLASMGYIQPDCVLLDVFMPDETVIAFRGKARGRTS
jgi:FixJ family two-component response regulator